jgi:hypothetical protein
MDTWKGLAEQIQLVILGASGALTNARVLFPRQICSASSSGSISSAWASPPNPRASGFAPTAAARRRQNRLRGIARIGLLATFNMDVHLRKEMAIPHAPVHVMPGAS